MKLLPLNEQQDLIEAASKGIAVQVYLDVEDYDPKYQKQYFSTLGFTGREQVKSCIILSEIANSPGHYVVVGKNNQLACGLHGDIFYVDADD